MAKNRIGILIETTESGSKAASNTVTKNLGQIKASSVESSKAVGEAALSTNEATKTVGNTLTATAPKASAFADSFRRIRDVALGVYLPQVGLKLLQLGKDALTSAGNFEQARVSFETMLGSAAKAQDLLTQISVFAKETPFDLPGVVSASKQLLAYGIAQEDIIPTLRKLGDVAAGVSIPIGQLSNVYGQVRVAGKLLGQDLLQFTQAGVPLLDYLAQTMGKTTAQIKKDMENGVGPTFDNVKTAIDAMTASGSKFGGLMDKQSHTFQGVMSNIGDSFGQIGRAALGMDTAGNIVKNSFFDRIKKAAEAAMPALQVFADGVGPAVQDGITKLVELGKQVGDYVGPKFAALGETVSRNLLPALTKLWQNVLVPLMPVIGVTLVAALGVAVDALNVITGAVSFLIDGFVTGNPVIISFAAAFGVLGAAMALNSAFTAITAGFATLRLVTIPSTVASFVALKALIATPLVMPAIAVAAAIASIVLVYDAAKKAFDAIQGAKEASSNNLQATRDILKRNQEVQSSSFYSPATKAAWSKVAENAINADAKLYGHALGTTYAPGGQTVVGEHGKEVVNLPAGSTVTPAYRSRAEGSQGGRAGHTIIVQEMNINNGGDQYRMLKDIGFALELAS